VPVDINVALHIGLFVVLQMISPCRSVDKKNIHHRLNITARSPSLVSCTSPRSKSHSESLGPNSCHTADRQQTVEKSTFPLSEGTDDRDSYAKSSGTGIMKAETVTAEHLVCHDTAADDDHRQRLDSEDELHTSNFSHRFQNDISVNIDSCHSSPLSESACMNSTSGIDTEISFEPTKHQLSIATDVTAPRHRSDLSPADLSPSYSVCDTDEESQFGQHTVSEETASPAGSETDTGRIQPRNAQDFQQQEGPKDLLTEDSARSDMSDEDCVSAAEQNEPVTEAGSKSATVITVTADVHRPASPPLFSTDEEDEFRSRSPQAEEEPAKENEEVSILVT